MTIKRINEFCAADRYAYEFHACAYEKGWRRSTPAKAPLITALGLIPTAEKLYLLKVMR